MSTLANSTTPGPVTAHGRRRGLRRRTMTAAGFALFMGGLIFGEAIEAVAALDTPVAAVDTDAQLLGLAQRDLEAREAAQVEALSVELFDRLSTQLTALAPEAIATDRQEIWNVLADCESGDWKQGVPIYESRRWDSTAGFFEGGLQFHPRTWDGFRDEDMPGNAYEATPIQQMVVAERVLDTQGWKAWPVCSRKVGYR